MKFFQRTSLFYLNILHIFNDGFQASYLLVVPFIAKDLHLDLTQVGILGSVFKVATILFALPAGIIAKKFGGLKSLTAALCVYAVGYLVTGLSANYSLLLVAALIAGIGFGIFHPIGFSLVAKWTKGGKRGKIMGDFTATGDVGKVALSAGITFLAVAVGWRNTTLAYALLVAALFFFMRFSSIEQEAESHEGKYKPLLAGTKELLRNKKFTLASIAGALDAFATSPFFLFLPFLLLKKGVNPVFLGSFTALYLLGNLTGKALLGRFTDKLGSIKIFVFSELLNVVFILALLWVSDPIAIIVVSFLLGTLTKGTSPVAATMVADSLAPEESPEHAFGLNSFILNSTTVVSPIILGYFSTQFGIVSAFYLMCVAIFLAVVPALGYSFVYRRESF